MAEVRIDLQEFDEIRDKAKKYDELMLANRAGKRDFQSVLSNHLRVMLSKSLEMNRFSPSDRYALIDRFHVKADINNPFVKDVTITLENPDRSGFYNAEVTFNYDYEKPHHTL